MKFKKIIAVLLLITSVASVLFGCKKKGEVISNESTRLVLASAELDGVFNPFYSSSAADGTIIGMTQIGMLSSDRFGKVAYGENEACVVLDYQAQYILDDGSVVNEIKTGDTVTNTRYRFVLKNDLKFSNGSPLTMKDVLFNLYVYLDPAYYGSSTIYSTDIVGLQEYRTQMRSEEEQKAFEKHFNGLATDRVDRLLECLEYVYDMNEGTTLTDDKMISELTTIMNELVGDGSTEGETSVYATVVDDYNLAKKYFLDELKKDYGYARGTAEDISFTDKNGNKVTLSTDTEAFLFNAALITWNEKEKQFEYGVDEDAKYWSEEQAINAIYTTYVPNQMINVLTRWQTAYDLHTYFAYLEKEAFFGSNQDKINNVSGIKFVNRTEGGILVNGKEYGIPEYNADGSVKSGNEVLEITIKEVDPKAIWNFAFTVAPMYYYSNEAQISIFDYEKNFGVEFGSISFQDEVIKNSTKIGVPVGAGPYKATTKSGDSSKVSAGSFKEHNVVYFERNENFMFPVKIKYVNYQVVSTNLMLDTLYSGGVHFVEPACKQENIDSITARASEGFAYEDVRTNGYGYIGINAEKIPDVAARRAIMHAINTKLAVDYYLGYSDSIYRPMTKESWAYPEDDGGKQYYEFDPTGATSVDLMEKAGFTTNSDGIWTKDGHTCKYVFTIAGDSADHPAYNSLKQAAEILNENGFDIEVKTDINALSKLNNGDLTVWAAAWGAGVDPDMYQVYHIDSTAGSTANWGYRAIKKNAGNRYDYELGLVEYLSDIIDRARETLNQDRRIELYEDALNTVMELAVELPTYQRSDLFAYNSNIIDASTLTPPAELTSYNGPLNRIWEVGLKETK